MTANTNYPDNITALYARLSQEDTLDGEPIRRKSCSNTQRTIIFPIPHFSLMTVFPVSLSIDPVGMR